MNYFCKERLLDMEKYINIVRRQDHLFVNVFSIVAFLTLLFSNSLFAQGNGKVIILNSDTSIEKYSIAHTVFKSKISNPEDEKTKARVSFLKNKKSILVVDDDKHIRKLLKQTFESEGYNIIEACNGFEAIVKAKEIAPDLIIPDIMMPGINGLDVVAALKNDIKTKNIPIVINTVVDEKLDFSKHDIAGYFAKPVNMDEMIRRIKVVLSKKE